MLRPAGLALLLAALSAAPAHAAGFTVSTAADGADQTPADGLCKTVGGACTLRAALEQANSLAGADTVAVPARTYLLTVASALAISTPVTVTGEGAATTIVDAGGDTQVLTITGGAAVVKGLTFRNGAGDAAVEISGGDHVLEAVAIRDSTHSGSANVFGGGLSLSGTASLQLSNSAITGNRLTTTTGQAAGGGIVVGLTANLIVTRSTIAGNRADGTQGGSSAFAGGIYSLGTTALRHVTVAGNTATGFIGSGGGNLYTHPSSAAVAVEDSIIADGSASTEANCGGKAIVPQGRNLDTGTTCGLTAPNITGMPANLATLGSHGGPTDSMPPLLGSAVVDAAAACGTGSSDQRGNPTPAGAACDIGAAELASDRSVTLVQAPDTVEAGQTTTFVAKAANAGFDPGAVTLTFEPPAGATTVLVDSSQGSCTGAVCELGVLDSGESASATLVVRFPAAGSATTVARVSGPVPDAAAANDTASVATTITAVPTTPTTDPVVTPTVKKCVVPKLKGKTLKAARKALTEAQCKLGKVRKPKGVKSTKGLVVRKQTRKVQLSLAAGTKVGVTLRRKRSRAARQP